MKSKTYRNPLIPSNKDNLSILVIDDEKLVSQVLTRALESEPDLEIVGTVDNAHSAVENISILSPDIVLVDIEMPEIDGLTLTSMITEEFPNIKVIIYSSHYEQEYIRKALMSGAKGYLIKDHAIEEIADAIRFVNKGFFHLGKGLLKKISTNSQSLGKDNGLPISRTAASSIEKDLLVSQTEKQLTNSPSVGQDNGLPIPSKVDSSIEKDLLVSQNEKQPSKSSVEGGSPPTKDLLDTLPRVWTRRLAFMLIVLAGVLIPWISMSRVGEYRNCPIEFNFGNPSADVSDREWFSTGKNASEHEI